MKLKQSTKRMNSGTYEKVKVHVIKTLMELATEIQSTPSALAQIETQSGLGYVAMLRACIALDILTHLENSDRDTFSLDQIITETDKSLAEAILDELRDLQADIENCISV